MEHAIAFAETGHLCLGTLHANSASQTIERIIDFFPEETRRRLQDEQLAQLRENKRLAPKPPSAARRT